MTPAEPDAWAAALAGAAEVYGAILADPDRRAEILAHRRRLAEQATETTRKEGDTE